MLLESFIEKAKETHGDKYDYSKVGIISSKNKVPIICPKHGEFFQRPDNHLSGHGCRKCDHYNKIGYSNEEFIERAKEIHEDKYDYSKTEYKRVEDKIKIICPEHGEFEQKAAVHLRGKGCPECDISKKDDKEGFVKKAREVHGDKYDYSNSIYEGHRKDVNITCPYHGEFVLKAYRHKSGVGCPECNKEDKRKKKEKDFIDKANSIHNGKYDYSKVEFHSLKDNVTIICPEHGEFEQRPDVHLKGNGCKGCFYEIKIINERPTKEEFENKVRKIHGDKYDYSKVEYKRHDTPITIICPEHGEFEQRPDTHLRGGQCIKCNDNGISGLEEELGEFLNSLGVEFETNNRKILDGKELDIYIPERNLAIEFNGLYWHSEIFLDKNYHLNKTKECENKGVQLIHIFEDEWNEKKEIVKSILKNKLGMTENKIYARKCDVKEITNKEASSFLDNNHLQGSVKSSINLGLFYENELVSVATFNKPRLGMGKKHSEHYELSRVCSRLNTTVIGGASKLVDHFIKKYNPTTIKTYSDKRWGSGGLYYNIGFKRSHINKPNYYYLVGNERKHRFNYRKDKLVKEGYDENKSGHEIMLERGIYRIYDCGTETFEMTLT